MTKTPESKKTGLDYLRENEGEYGTDLPEELEILRANVSGSMEEIITFGGRVRVLSLNNSPVGWIRGLSSAERSWIGRLGSGVVERSKMTINLATTLTQEQVSKLNTVEIKRLLFLIYKMSRADSSLMPWILPYTTTSSSERMCLYGELNWKTIQHPEGAFRVVAPSEVLIQWNYLSKLRQESKEVIRGLGNSALVVQAMIGKGANSLRQDLRNSNKLLSANIAKPWLEVGADLVSKDHLDDGWGHTLQDSSIEGMMRELKGMVEEDKHEQLMKAIAEEQRQKAIDQRNKIRSMENRFEGIQFSESVVDPRKMAEEERANRVKQKAAREQRSREQAEMLERSSDTSPESKARRAFNIEV